METSERGIQLIKKFEGLRLEAYRCSAYVWTIGWGSTIVNGIKVREGDRITEDEAEKALIDDLEKFETIVNNRITTKINQNQFDALVSHTYNTGGSDGLFELVNTRDSNKAIRNWFERTYITAGGKKMNGLVSRRKVESDLFFSRTCIFINTTKNLYAAYINAIKKK